MAGSFARATLKPSLLNAEVHIVDARCHLLLTLTDIERSGRPELGTTVERVQQIVRQLNDLELTIRAACQDAWEDRH
jgi:hypothetical protein